LPCDKFIVVASDGIWEYIYYYYELDFYQMNKLLRLFMNITKKMIAKELVKNWFN